MKKQTEEQIDKQEKRQIYMGSTLWERLRVLADKNEVTMSELIREALKVTYFTK